MRFLARKRVVAMPKIDEMSKIIRERMEEYLNKQGWSFDGNAPGTKQASNVAIGKALTEYYAREIAYYTNHVNEEDKIDEGLECDGSNDLGIDFIYEKPDDKEFWIFQSKFKGKSAGLTRDEIAGFFNIHERILDRKWRAKANRTVGELLDRFTEKSSVNYVLLTNTKASDSNTDDFNALQRKKSALPEAENAQWILMDLSAIKSKHKQIQSGGDELPNVDIPIVQHIELPINGSGNKKYKSIVMIIQGTALNNLNGQHGDALFNYNIRGFLGNKGKNKQITETLGDEPSLFYLYNNGISAICTKMDVKPNQKGSSKIVSCKDFQIINGAQTVCSIRDFGKNDNNMEKLKKVNVLLRITEAEKVKGPTKGLNRDMIKYNNSQNVVRDADFRSNDPIQESLEAKFKKEKVQYRATPPFEEVVYMRKRVLPRYKTGKMFVSMDGMAKSLYAFKKDTPGKLNSSSKFLFDENDTDGYWSLFGDEAGEQVEMVTDGKFKEFAAVAILSRFLDYKLKAEIKETSADEIEGMVVRTGRLFLWAFGYAIRTFYADSQGKIYEKIMNGDAFKPKTDRKGFVHDWYDHIHEKFYGVLNIEADKGASGDSDDGKTLNFKVWLRNDKKMGRLKREMDYIGKHKDLPKI